MKQELQNRLYDNFAFYIKGESPFDYEVNRPWYGFECDDGWFELIYELSTKLKEAGFTGTVLQVKEKFGALRFYANGITNVHDKIIEKYEEKSMTTCEFCGEQGQLRGGGWIKCLCDDCYRKDINNLST